MSGFNWQAAGISFGVCFAGGMIVTYSLTLPGRKAWYFTPPTASPVKPNYNSMFTGELARSNVSPELPTSSSFDYSSRLPTPPSAPPMFASAPAPSAPPYDKNFAPAMGGKTRRKHKGKKHSHKKSRR